MLPFLLTLISTFIFLALSRNMNEKDKRFAAKYFLICSLIILILVPALRNNIGDTYVYVSSYKQVGDNTHTLAQIISADDPGFLVLNILLNKISSNPQILIFITALITQILYFRFFRKYETLLELEIFIYIASGYFLVTMNGIRQCLAGAIILNATKYIEEKKIFKYITLILIASTIHQSALIMIPFYWIARIKPWTKITWIITVIASIGFFIFWDLVPKLFQLLKGSQYEHYNQVFLDGIEQGANPIRFLVALVPLILAYKVRNDLENDKRTRIFVNMSIFNLIFMMFSLYTWIFARFTIYFNFYNFILLPYIIKIWPSKKDKKLLYFGLVLCYFIFFLIEYRGWIYGSNYTIRNMFYNLVN